MDADHTIRSVGRAVDEYGRFLDVGDRIDAEAPDTLVEPKICRRKEGCAHLRIFPVEIGLRFSKSVKVILPALGAVRPRRPAKDAAPVRRCAAILFAVAPDVPIVLWIGTARL